MSWSQLTNSIIFQNGWNHQPVIHAFSSSFFRGGVGLPKPRGTDLISISKKPHSASNIQKTTWGWVNTIFFLKMPGGVLPSTNQLLQTFSLGILDGYHPKNHGYPWFLTHLTHGFGPCLTHGHWWPRKIAPGGGETSPRRGEKMVTWVVPTSRGIWLIAQPYPSHNPQA